MKEIKFATTVTGHVNHRNDDEVAHVSTLAKPWQKWRAVVHVGRYMHWEWFRTKRLALAWINSWRPRT